MAHPTATNVLLMRCAQGLYRSVNGGDNWDKLSDEPGVSLAPDYGTAGRILWVKDDDLWASTDQGATWRRIVFWRWPFNVFVPAVLRP